MLAQSVRLTTSVLPSTGRERVVGFSAQERAFRLPGFSREASFIKRCDRRASSQASHPPKSTSNVRQKPGHQLGTPRFSMNEWWKKSNTPWLTMAAETNHGIFPNPIQLKHKRQVTK